jgi:hypothetical protein
MQRIGGIIFRNKICVNPKHPILAIFGLLFDTPLVFDMHLHCGVCVSVAIIVTRVLAQ